MVVAYFVGRRVLLSYVDAISQSKRYEQYCNMETNTSEELVLMILYELKNVMHIKNLLKILNMMIKIFQNLIKNSIKVM